MPWPRFRTFRGQLTAGFILLELLFTLTFAVLIVRAQLDDLRVRGDSRIRYQSNLLTLEASDALANGEMSRLAEIARTMRSSPTIERVLITDTLGKLLVSSDREAVALSPREFSYTKIATRPQFFLSEDGARESISPLYGHGRLLGFGFVLENRSAEQEQIGQLYRIAVLFGLVGALGCVVASTWLARAITRPLHQVMDATRKLIRDPETREGFPLAIHSANEAGELANAFNLLVLSMEQQRAGLSDTLALLDSMLAHAPIGFAFFDRKNRFVRVNQFLAEKTGIPVTRFLGRSINEIFSPEPACVLEEKLGQVFATGAAALDLELQPALPLADGEQRSWLVNIYPVKTGQGVVRWAGAVVLDTTERKRAEITLRRTEKLAVAGQLAASIAHEINNPLEAVMNLLFLIRSEPSLGPQALEWTAMAEHQVARVSEIAQQTLRFYRQSTLPAIASVPEILDSILTLHTGRAHNLRVEIDRRYGPGADLFCLSGGLRQIFANLIGNALDAMPNGGRLILRVRRSQAWRHGASGVRITVADTGMGMSEAVRQRIFEAFFTTKEATGTGLGLWVSLEIVQKHRGSIAVRSRPQLAAQGRSGTVFMLFFPDDGMPSPGPEAEAGAAALQMQV